MGSSKKTATAQPAQKIDAAIDVASFDQAEPPQVGRTSIWKDQDIRRVLGTSLTMEWGRYALAALAMAVVAVTTAGTAFMMQRIVDTMTLPQMRGEVFFVAGTVAAIFFVKGLATYAQVILLTQAGLRIVSQQQGQVYRSVLGQSADFFHQRETSMVVTVISRGAAAARAVTDTLLNAYVRDLLTLLGLIGVMLFHQPVLSFIALLVGPIAVFGVRGLLKRSRALASQELRSSAEIIKIVQETVAGFNIIKVFSAEKHMTQRMEDAVEISRERALSMTKLSAVTSPLMDTLSGLAIAAIVCLSAFQVFGTERATAGEILSFVTALLMAYEPAKRLANTRLQIDRNLLPVRRLFHLMDSPPSLKEASDAVDIPPGDAAVDLVDVSFSYGRKPVLKNITHHFAAGKTTALVGPSGGGKSTIFNLILRLADPLTGEVRLNGQNIAKVRFASLRQSLSLVSQDTFLFSASVLENLRIGRPDAREDEVIAAAKLANAHEFIVAMPHGYATQIGENGTLLSGGQKQRLAIARAVLKQSPVILLDEATSALDANSEELVRDSFDKIASGVTMIVIAHRLSSILKADEICYVEAGKIVESGALRSLLDKPDGKFRALFDKQFREASAEYLQP